MIDTVVLFIDSGDYCITDRLRFLPPLQLHNDEAVPYTKHLNNPSKQDSKLHYYPRITLYHRSLGGTFTSPIKIEFSVPKLLYGNNVDELTDTDFEQIVDTLQSRCAEMGVRIFSHAIKQARVNVIHFSKNILLSEGYTSTLAIQAIAKMNSSIMRDHNKTDFRNEGHAYQLYTPHRSIVFYDKVSDASKSKTRRIDKDQGNQIFLLGELRKVSGQLEVLRIEIRLTNHQTIKKDLKRFNLNLLPTFQDLFSEQLARMVIRSYWEKIYDPRSRFIASFQQSPQAVLKTLLSQNPKMTPGSAIELVGLYALARDDAGLLGLRNAIQTHRRNHNWHRLKKRYEAFKSPPYPLDAHGFIYDIETQLNTFKPIRMLVADMPLVRHNHQ